MRNTQSDIEIMREIRPYLRTAMAFLVHLRTPSFPREQCYLTADEFLTQLEVDLENLVRQ